MSDEFRLLLKQVGSGTHTSQSLSQVDAARATAMMLKQEATPAQIGAFMIAHRIRRPTSEELAGMLDAYAALGPAVDAIASPQVYVFCHAYDGRTRTAPVAPFVGLILASAGIACLFHGGKRMPTKFGVPLAELWQLLGVDWTTLSLQEMQRVFAATKLGLVYLPNHFPLADGLTGYRSELGKRPPLASMELAWNPYRGPATLVSGFVHPPTEERLLKTIQMREQAGVPPVCKLFVKGLEGSCDLPRNRPCIMSRHQEGSSERLILHPQEYGIAGHEVAYEGEAVWARHAQQVLAGEKSESGLEAAVVWNSGFYLWQAGQVDDLEAGISQSREILTSGRARKTLEQLVQAVSLRSPQQGT